MISDNDNEKLDEKTIPGDWKAQPIDYTFWRHTNVRSPVTEPSPFAKEIAEKARKESAPSPKP